MVTAKTKFFAKQTHKYEEMTHLHQKKGLCNFAKYVAALLVVNGHLFLFGGYEGDAVKYMNFGACCVALFFFFSGYGLTYSYMVKGDAYLKGFFNKRFTKILLPVVTAYSISLPIYALLKGPINVSTLISTLYWGGPYLKFTWFVSEIAVVYLLFYFSMKLPRIPLNTKFIMMSGLIMLFMATLFAFNQPMWYIISLPGFLLGTWYCRSENRLAGFCRKHLGPLMVVWFVLWFLTWQWNDIFGSILPEYRYAFIASFISPAAFTCLITLLLTTLPDYPHHLHVTDSSYEVYLMQSTAMTISSAVSGNFLTYWISTMLLVVFIGYAIHLLNSRILRSIKL